MNEGVQPITSHSTRVDSRTEQEELVELIFCNPDLIWRGAYVRPRLGQGGFREALQGIHQVGVVLVSTPYAVVLVSPPSIGGSDAAIPC